MSIKKIVASAGIAAGALVAMTGIAGAAPEQLDAIGKVSELGDSAGVSTLHNTGGGVAMIHDGDQVIGG